MWTPAIWSQSKLILCLTNSFTRMGYGLLETNFLILKAKMIIYKVPIGCMWDSWQDVSSYDDFLASVCVCHMVIIEALTIQDYGQNHEQRFKKWVRIDNFQKNKTDCQNLLKQTKYA